MLLLQADAVSEEAIVYVSEPQQIAPTTEEVIDMVENPISTVQVSTTVYTRYTGKHLIRYVGGECGSYFWPNIDQFHSVKNHTHWWEDVYCNQWTVGHWIKTWRKSNESEKNQSPGFPPM